MSSRSRKILEEWLGKIEVKGSVLDVGGSQNSIKGRTKTWEVDTYKIVDLEKPHKGEDPNYAYDLNSDAWNWAQYDNVFCIEVMEYIYNPIRAIESLNKMLKKGGNLYISFHTLYGLHNPKGEDCLRYTKNGIKKLFKDSGFIFKGITTRKISEGSKIYLEQFYRNEGMRLDFDDPETYHCGYLIKLEKL